MLRAFALASLLLAACGARASSGPAWPKMAKADDDGGESLAPRPGAAAVAVAAADDSDDDDDIKVVATPAADKPADKSAEKPADKPTTTAPEETIMIDDIVIEIDGD
jgi:hypothetical protein